MMQRLFKWLGLYDADGRRAWAFLSTLLGCGIMTGLATWAMWLVRADPLYIFLMGMFAQLQVLVALTGFTAMFMRREYDVDLKGGKLKVKDLGHVELVDEQNGRTYRIGGGGDPADSSGGDESEQGRPDQEPEGR